MVVISKIGRSPCLSLQDLWQNLQSWAASARLPVQTAVTGMAGLGHYHACLWHNEVMHLHLVCYTISEIIMIRCGGISLPSWGPESWHFRCGSISIIFPVECLDTSGHDSLDAVASLISLEECIYFRLLSLLFLFPCAWMWTPNIMCDLTTVLKTFSETE